MTFAQRLVGLIMRLISRLICRVDDAEKIRIPTRGPLILVANHVNFLDVPVAYSHLLPRPLSGFAKIETWNNLALGCLFSLFKAIPIRRGEVDLTAFRSGLEALQAGKILAVAPEGTRSSHGRLQRGRPGIVLLALQSETPIQPMVYYGHEAFHQNIRRLKRTDFFIRVGQPFHLDLHGEKLTRELRQHMIDEVMYQMAALLPPEYRGVYADFTKATDNYLRFPPGSHSNLPKT